MATNMSKTQNCTNLTWHWYWTTNPVGATKTRSKKKKFFKNTRSSTIRPHHTNPSNFTNKQINWNTQFNKNKTLHNGLALSKTMTNLTTHPADKPQTHTRQSRFFFSQTSVTNVIPSPTFLTRKVLTVSKKKTHQREREWGRRVHQHEAPTPAGSIKNQLPPKKRGRKGRNPAIEDRGIKTSSVPSESSSG